MQIHSLDPDAVCIDLESDMFSLAHQKRIRVYRITDAGASWEPLTEGLPQKNAYETVLRDAMTVDSLDSAEIYFGTRSGKLFGSMDEGATWRQIADSLPPVVCVKTAVMTEQ